MLCMWAHSNSHRQQLKFPITKQLTDQNNTPGTSQGGQVWHVRTPATRKLSQAIGGSITLDPIPPRLGYADVNIPIESHPSVLHRVHEMNMMHVLSTQHIKFRRFNFNKHHQFPTWITTGSIIIIPQENNQKQRINNNSNFNISQ